MTWDKTQPIAGSDFKSAPVRGNFLAVDEALLGANAKAQIPPDLTVLIAAFRYIGTDAALKTYAGGSSPSLTAPATNPRIAVLTIDSAGTLAWTYGAEAPSPAAPNYPVGKVALIEVYSRPGMTQIKDADDSVQGYVARIATKIVPVPASASAGGAPIIRLSIEGATLPDGSGTGNTPAEMSRLLSSAAQTANTPQVTRTAAGFNPTTDTHLSWTFLLPSNWGAGGLLRLKWFCVPTTGNVVWKAGTSVVIDGTTSDVAMAFTAADLATTAAAGVTRTGVETTLTLTPTNFAAGRLITLFVGRDADHAADTMTGHAYLIGAQFEYTPGMSVQFNALDTVLTLANYAPGNQVTWFCWLYLDGVGENNVNSIFNPGPIGTRRAAMSFNAAAAPFPWVFAVIWTAGVGIWTAAGTYATGAWHSYTVTYDYGSTANDPIFYLDGVAISNTEGGAPVGTAPADNVTLYLGNDETGLRTLNGKLAEVAVWSRLLSPAEVAAVHHLGVLAIPNSLYLYWPLDTIGAGAPVQDLSGNGRSWSGAGGFGVSANPPTRPAGRRG